MKTPKKAIVLMLDRATLADAQKGRSTKMLIAISEIATVTEFVPQRLPDIKGMSIITTKKKEQHPILGTPEEIYELIREANGEEVA
jgi:hypothetical protein